MSSDSGSRSRTHGQTRIIVRHDDRQLCDYREPLIEETICTNPKPPPDVLHARKFCLVGHLPPWIPLVRRVDGGRTDFECSRSSSPRTWSSHPARSRRARAGRLQLQAAILCTLPPVLRGALLLPRTRPFAAKCVSDPLANILDNAWVSRIPKTTFGAAASPSMEMKFSKACFPANSSLDSDTTSLSALGPNCSWFLFHSQGLVDQELRMCGDPC